MATKTTSLSNSEYRSVKAWSKSDLDLIHQSLGTYEWARNSPHTSSDSVDLGTHVHCALLEPDEFKKQYLKMPEFNLRTNDGREEARYHQSMAESQGKIILSPDDYAKVIAMRDSVLCHPTARDLLTLSGESEVSIFGEINGMRVKCRPDRIPEMHHFGPIVADLKKTVDIDKFLYSVRDYRYHVQAAFYSDIYKQLTGEAPRFVFVVVGETRSIGRHPVKVLELPPDVVDIGRSEYLADLEMAREYEEYGCGFSVESFDMRGIIR